jgi:hypothetical protein
MLLEFVTKGGNTLVPDTEGYIFCLQPCILEKLFRDAYFLIEKKGLEAKSCLSFK